jgi:hypothetical protein
MCRRESGGRETIEATNAVDATGWRGIVDEEMGALDMFFMKLANTVVRVPLIK